MWLILAFGIAYRGSSLLISDVCENSPACPPCQDTFLAAEFADFLEGHSLFGVFQNEDAAIKRGRMPFLLGGWNGSLPVRFNFQCTLQTFFCDPSGLLFSTLEM